MTPFLHRLSFIIYFSIIIIAIGVLSYIGYSYYHLPLEERFFHPSYQLLKPSGFIGHGLGIVGTVLILIGLFGYMARKRFKILSQMGDLKYWLECHIFLCTLGPVMIVFHTSFKFGGIVSVGFWSMVVVWTSGVIGRYIYLQIPRSIEGRALNLLEVKKIKEELDDELLNRYQLDASTVKDNHFSQLKLALQAKDISKEDLKRVKQLIKTEKSIARRIERLDQMQGLFRNWHIAHLPFALILLLIMVIHVAVSLTFGYKWVF